MRVQAPQALCGGGGGLQAGDRLVEGIASRLLGLQATSSPALAVQALGDVLEVSTSRKEGQVAIRWPLSTWAASALCSSRNLGSRGAHPAVVLPPRCLCPRHLLCQALLKALAPHSPLTPEACPGSALSCVPLLCGALDTETYSGVERTFERCLTETSLVVQWLRLHAPNVGDPGSIPHAAANKTRSSQVYIIYNM